MKIILISGKSGHGKDTFADMLKLNLNNSLKLHFGDCVKFFATMIYHWDGVKDERGRQILQSFGSEVRDRDKSFWADIVARLAFALQNKFDYVLVPDWRYNIEYEAVKKYFSDSEIYLIRITRGEDYFNPLLTKEQREHSSEKELDLFPFSTVINNTTLPELRKSAKEIAELIKGDKKQ